MKSTGLVIICILTMIICSFTMIICSLVEPRRYFRDNWFYLRCVFLCVCVWVSAAYHPLIHNRFLLNSVWRFQYFMPSASDTKNNHCLSHNFWTGSRWDFWLVTSNTTFITFSNLVNFVLKIGTHIDWTYTMYLAKICIDQNNVMYVSMQPNITL